MRPRDGGMVQADVVLRPSPDGHRLPAGEMERPRAGGTGGLARPVRVREGDDIGDPEDVPVREPRPRHRRAVPPQPVRAPGVHDLPAVAGPAEHRVTAGDDRVVDDDDVRRVAPEGGVLPDEGMRDGPGGRRHDEPRCRRRHEDRRVPGHVHGGRPRPERLVRDRRCDGDPAAADPHHVAGSHVPRRAGVQLGVVEEGPVAAPEVRDREVGPVPREARVVARDEWVVEDDGVVGRAADARLAGRERDLAALRAALDLDDHRRRRHRAPIPSSGARRGLTRAVGPEVAGLGLPPPPDRRLPGWRPARAGRSMRMSRIRSADRDARRRRAPVRRTRTREDEGVDDDDDRGRCRPDAATRRRARRRRRRA